MPAYFLDSSAVLKRYVTEAGSQWVQQLFNPPGTNHILVSVLCGVEVIAAIARRSRGGGLAPAVASRVMQEFRTDLSTDFRPVNLTPAILQQAMNLADRRGLRGYDAVQLATALAANAAAVATGTSMTLVSADLELNSAAAAEGLAVEDPNSHP